MDILILGGAGQVGTVRQPHAQTEDGRLRAPELRNLTIIREATITLAAGPHAMIVNATTYPLPVKRPANVRLSTRSLSDAFGIAPRPWEAALDDILDRLVGPVRSH